MSDLLLSLAADLIVRVHGGDPTDIAELLADLDGECARQLCVVLASAANPEASMGELRKVDVDKVDREWRKRVHALFERYRRIDDPAPAHLIDGEVAYQRWRHRNNQRKRQVVADKTAAIRNRSAS